MLADIEYLASDDLAGRYSLNDDIHRAADWIATRFRALGLSPVGADYVVPYPLATGIRTTGEHAIAVRSAGGESTTLRAEEFEPVFVSASAAVEGEVFFVGYAAASSDVGQGRAYDDLAGVDLTGKIALVLLGAPRQPDVAALMSAVDYVEEQFDGEVRALGSAPAADKLRALHQRARDDLATVLRDFGPTLPPAFWTIPQPPTPSLGLTNALNEVLRQMRGRFAFAPRSLRVRTKTERLVAAGAKGVIFVRGPASFLSERARQADEVSPVDAERRLGVADSGAVVMHMKWRAADRLFRIGGKKLSSVQADIDRDLMPRSQPAGGTTVRLAASVAREQALLPNVVAQLPGTDLAHEVVVVGAHFDHVGHGDESTGMCSATTPEDDVCNGADDNASGTAVVLELARLTAQAPARPRRTLVFVLFSGEELGLLGSSAFVRESPYDLTRTVAMINFDMVGRFNADRGLAIGGVGSSAGWMPLLDRLGARGLHTTYDRAVVSRSDHANFYKHDIPVLFLFTGLHRDYHRAGDHANKINREGMATIGELAGDILIALGDGYAVPFATPRPGEGLVDVLPGADPTTIEKRVGAPDDVGHSTAVTTRP
ncbi:MAG: M20/M25/M40 family metallo-hydrolase [Myxococcales bacterium FL481]|nr:MAG: M20/M25/M40 family metallo-hydrolase [Myxococcales bacterium FL481]